MKEKNHERYNSLDIFFFLNANICLKGLYVFFYSIVVYEGGDVVSQARSLWRLELGRTKWAGGFINWMHPLRIRHITSGRYLGVNENNDLILVHRYNEHKIVCKNEINIIHNIF